MTQALVHGTVLAADGTPVPGARVTLYPYPATIPALGSGVAESLGPHHAISAQTGEFFFAEKDYAGLATALGKGPAVVQAVHGNSASPPVRFTWPEERHLVATIRVEEGVIGEILARWTDGAAAEVSIVLLLQYDQTAGASPPAMTTIKGDTDSNGRLRFGPLPDVRLERVTLIASHPDAPDHMMCWDEVSLSAPLELVMPRGRMVRGQLVTSGGAPARDLFVAPWFREGGDPWPHACLTDEDGRFATSGVASSGGALAVFDRPTPGALGKLGNLLFIRDVTSDEDDVGMIRLPKLADWEFRVEGKDGHPPLRGNAFWRGPAGVRSSSCRLDADGWARLKRVPTDTRIVFHVQIVDSTFGSLEQSFRIDEIPEGVAPLRVVGSGTVIVRFRPSGAPRTALQVSDAALRVGSRVVQSELPCAELRCWVEPDQNLDVAVTAAGFRSRELRSIRVQDDGPTYLDVELEPV